MGCWWSRQNPTSLETLLCQYAGTRIILLVDHYYTLSSLFLVQGLIFVVDSNDRERAKEAKDELDRMVSYYIIPYDLISSNKSIITQLMNKLYYCVLFLLFSFLRMSFVMLCYWFLLTNKTYQMLCLSLRSLTLLGYTKLEIEL